MITLTDLAVKAGLMVQEGENTYWTEGDPERALQQFIDHLTQQYKVDTTWCIVSNQGIERSGLTKAEAQAHSALTHNAYEAMLTEDAEALFYDEE
jgi:hypothetical protein